MTERAEWALHQRTALACAAAVDAGLPGRFRVWEHAGLMAVLATDPALGFLCTVTGVAPRTVPVAIELVAAPVWGDAGPKVIVGTAVERPLRVAGLARVGYRALAVRRLDDGLTGSSEADVIDAGGDSAFLDVLLAGYEVDGVVAAFIAAEHRTPAVRRFLALAHDEPIAAAAMTIHGDVAVLGAASTLRSRRGQGAQSRLLRHRLQVAAQAHCTLAVATAKADSVSAANLGRAGFRILRRSVWTKRP